MVSVIFSIEHVPCIHLVCSKLVPFLSWGQSVAASTITGEPRTECLSALTLADAGGMEKGEKVRGDELV